ncbi:MAG: sugar transferase [Lentisphaeria bacterium]|nr:sugar transferase [Lentisphaeria bacterium]
MAESLRNFRFFHSQHGLRWRIWDFLIGLVSFFLGFHVSPFHYPGHQMPQGYYFLIVGGFFGLLLMFFSRICAVPNPEDRGSKYELFTSSLIATGIAYTAFSVVVGLVLVRIYGRYIAGTVLLVSFSGIFLPRFILSALFRLNPVKIVLLGTGQNAEKLLNTLRGSKRFICQGVMPVKSDETDQSTFHGFPILKPANDGGVDQLTALNTEIVVITLSAGDFETHDNEAIFKLPQKRIDILNKGSFLETFYKKTTVEYGCPSWFASSSCLPGSSSFFFIKRLIDIAFSFPALIISLPLWGLIAIAIKITSPGPVFFTQERVGLGGKIFNIIKFRTMAVDAEKDGAQWAVKNDPRATRLGRFLRITRLDEVPQLINVLLGHMSLVGPRPERPEFVNELSKDIPFYDYRHMVPPGLTGWAQIMYKYGATKEDAMRKLEYDLYYTRRLSLQLDIEIILRTLPMIMKGSR